jgi:hypothetical protein
VTAGVLLRGCGASCFSLDYVSDHLAIPEQTYTCLPFQSTNTNGIYYYDECAHLHIMIQLPVYNFIYILPTVF